GHQGDHHLIMKCHQQPHGIMAHLGRNRRLAIVWLMIWLFPCVSGIPRPNSDTAGVALGGGLVNLGGGTFGGVERVDNGVASGVGSVSAQLGDGGVGNGGGACSKWCITSQKQIYCCPQKLPQQKSKSSQCPPLRRTCPTSFVYSQCSQDTNCSGDEKCCYDNCLQLFACKKRQYYG
ncbi:unnamed protein product, partial [Meganyctiphanes norvegica]